MINKQDFINAIEQNIEMVRGDTMTFNFTLKGLSQSDCEALEVEFNVSDTPSNGACITCEIDDGVDLVSYSDNTALFAVCVSPDKTKDLDLARYYYNLQIKDEDNVLTLMRGRFTLLYDIKGEV